MRYVRFRRKGEPAAIQGWLDGDQVGVIAGPLFGAHRRLPVSQPLNSVRLTAPWIPGKIICVGRNYADHAREHNVDIPDVPLLFMKPPSAVIGPGEEIVLPPQSEQVEHEGELAVVVGRRIRNATTDEAMAAVFGYTIANDVTARDLQKRDGQWTRAKGFDTFCPLGPWIDTEVNPHDLRITCRVNGRIRQLESTREMVFSIAQLVSFVSGIMTLDQGDLLLTGTPAGVGKLAAGDTVQVEIEGIGILENPVLGPETAEPETAQPD
ncbi:MAG: 2-hydroxyhepta-2,4-diene-1,7-dioate isomerase [Chloroflexi bacterium RBG_13_60_9]|nr:MAG: 2-hydroxyhepta-2,4-diene-1,7-dioate isomerase [Chloroflexi bacterium RBG_13_60_9]